MRNPALGLYIHVPWCVQKCPYCDFNSHTLKQSLPEAEYVAHLLDDLAADAHLIDDRMVTSIFIGGGTPSLLSAEAIATLLAGVRQRVALSPSAEITLEANPGTVESERFTGYQQAGVNRISIGIQSFQHQHLQRLGRIHDAAQAQAAAGYARSAKLRSFNLDLMHGLPEQSLENALGDLRTAIGQNPPHLSWYQLTLEPNTPFYSRPPELPDDDLLWEIQAQGHALLEANGYRQYEISAYSQAHHQCQHNLNYWRFGDYLGIGCGAHGKITNATAGTITRTVKVKHPRGYMQLNRDYLDQRHLVASEDRPFEFFMNRLRLVEPCPKEEFSAFTGIENDATISRAIQTGFEQELLTETADAWQVTAKGRRYLNSLLELFV
ncbi:radical SAM family heme chaperone HemW [Alteromonas sp. ASW11-36]|uniref:Heme chaperone HemW n=1 Tax=Alteromonas arenosi TaxID=3055817 RepID=A0ABT7T0H3_9ALTE|nr:radical SAM family heme chaperone HemW [Alteromonas sp. ASW11-36]MDM7861938.1 radical SAM family heme chaperone HemW [Alteromonas sp. ASW11-36]